MLFPFLIGRFLTRDDNQYTDHMEAVSIPYRKISNKLRRKSRQLSKLRFHSL